MAKEPTEKQLAARAKFAAASKKKAAERKAEKENPVPQQAPPIPQQVVVDAAAAREAEKIGGETYTPDAPEPKDPGAPQDPSVDQLQRAVLETLQNLFGNMGQAQTHGGASLSEARGIVGTKERYPVDPNHYPDPRERLSDEARLQTVAFKHNYELDYTCNPTRRYQTQDGIWQVEPQFTLQLNRVLLDPATSKPTSGRYTICRGIFFEDPDTAIQMAADLGMPIGDNEFDFLNEMRYIRMRDWLLDAFFTPIDTSPKKNKREMVIDGKQVEYFEVSGEDSQEIPFSQLKNKLKV